MFFFFIVKSFHSQTTHLLTLVIYREVDAYSLFICVYRALSLQTQMAGVEGFEPPMSESKSDALTNLATPLQTVGNKMSSLSFLQSVFIEKNRSLISVGHKKSP